MHQAIADQIAQFGVTKQTSEFLVRSHGLFMDGRFCDASSDERIPVIEPSTGEFLTDISSATTNDVDQAVASARRALDDGPWSAMKPNERQNILLRLADLIEAHAQTLAEIETLDNGKALGPCLEMDILGGADLLRYMAGWATKIDGATRQVSAPEAIILHTR